LFTDLKDDTHNLTLIPSLEPTLRVDKKRLVKTECN